MVGDELYLRLKTPFQSLIYKPRILADWSAPAQMFMPGFFFRHLLPEFQPPLPEISPSAMEIDENQLPASVISATPVVHDGCSRQMDGATNSSKASGDIGIL